MCKFSDFPLLFFILLTPAINAQVLNVDRELTHDSTRKNYDITANIFLSSDKQKNNLIDFSTNLEYDLYLKNKYVILAFFRNDAVFNGTQMIQNEGLSHLKYRDNDHRSVSCELFAQHQWNGAWGMKFRFLSGANLRLKFIEKDNLDIYGALGTFYEIEKWNWNGVNKNLVPQNASDIQRDIFRLNSYIKLSRKLTHHIDISAISYLQFPLNAFFSHPRWFVDANMYIAATDKLSLVLHWDHILDSYWVVPVDNFFYTFSMGLQVNL